VLLERKTKNLIKLCLDDSVLLNVFEAKITTLLKMLGDLYQVNPWLINFFCREKWFSLKIDDSDYVVEYLNAFNTFVT
jgi:hypothetical protein